MDQKNIQQIQEVPERLDKADKLIKQLDDKYSTEVAKVDTEFSRLRELLNTPEEKALLANLGKDKAFVDDFTGKAFFVETDLNIGGIYESKEGNRGYTEEKSARLKGYLNDLAVSAAALATVLEGNKDKIVNTDSDNEYFVETFISSENAGSSYVLDSQRYWALGAKFAEQAINSLPQPELRDTYTRLYKKYYGDQWRVKALNALGIEGKKKGETVKLPSYYDFRNKFLLDAYKQFYKEQKGEDYKGDKIPIANLYGVTGYYEKFEIDKKTGKLVVPEEVIKEAKKLKRKKENDEFFEGVYDKDFGGRLDPDLAVILTGGQKKQIMNDLASKKQINQVPIIAD